MHLIRQIITENAQEAGLGLVEAIYTGTDRFLSPGATSNLYLQNFELSRCNAQLDPRY